jgi:hypothetical protein
MKRESKLLGTCAVLLLLVGGVTALVLRQGPGESRSLWVDGVVIDADTSNTVAQAKIIVSAWGGGFFGLVNAAHQHVSTMSDNHGLFSVQTELRFAVHRLQIQASSPSDKYILIEANNGTHELRVQPLTEYHKKAGRFHYKGFSGMFRSEGLFEQNLGEVFDASASKLSR